MMLKRLVEQEKLCRTRQEKELSGHLEKLRSELWTLRAVALLLVDERQRHTEQSERQQQKVRELSRKVLERERCIALCNDKSKEDAQTIFTLEAELEQKSESVLHEREDTTNRLMTQESQMQQLQLQLLTLSSSTEQLQQENQALQRSEKDLKEPSPSVSSELETLRKKVLEMEGRDEELMKMESQCKEFKVKLQDSQRQSERLKLDVQKVQERLTQIEKLEDVFNKSRTDGSRLRAHVDNERQKVKESSSELESIRDKVKELQTAEDKFHQTETLLKDDVAKLKTLTLIIADERTSLAQRLKRQEEKRQENERKCQEEQAKASEVTEKLIEESKKLLKVKREMEEKVKEVQGRLKGEEEKSAQLNATLTSANAKIQDLEERENNLQNKLAKSERNAEEKSNMSEELSLEMDKLRSRLKRLEIVEDDLMKTGDEHQLLEKRFRSEQERSRSLAKAMEEMKAEPARSKATEKVEAETELRWRCRAEEEKNQELRAENHTLKEKIHELMNAEDKLAQLQEEHAAMTRRLREEEDGNVRRNQAFEKVTQELETMRRFSRVSRPSVSGRRMVEVPVTSAATQTEWSDDETTAGFIRKTVQEENSFMNRLRQKRTKPVLDRFPPAFGESTTRNTWNPAPQTRPLHIRVTPDAGNRRATLEITSPKAEEFFSSANVVHALRNPKMTIVPKPATAGIKVRDVRAQSPVMMEVRDVRAQSPVMMEVRDVRAQSPVMMEVRDVRAQSPVTIKVRDVRAQSPVMMEVRDVRAQSPVMMEVRDVRAQSPVMMEVRDVRAQSPVTIKVRDVRAQSPVMMEVRDVRAQSPVMITAVSKARNAGCFQTPVSIVTVSTTRLKEEAVSTTRLKEEAVSTTRLKEEAVSTTRLKEAGTGKTVIKMSSECPKTNFSANGNLMRTEDSTVHIHLRAPRSRGSSLDTTERHSPAKKSSSVMITPTNSNVRTARNTT
ncbi:filamin-A-interacting protein 1-like isoform X2 [Eucyclogobius newberryi]|uniref:filamin-A-interacting protein 1-like isoform X2 n=1 Tax=Eucyclogobius newberryi TaxID=166745 RepID=UPI003B5C66A7